MNVREELINELTKAEVVIRMCSRLLENNDAEKYEVGLLLENLATQIGIEVERFWEKQENEVKQENRAIFFDPHKKRNINEK